MNKFTRDSVIDVLKAKGLDLKRDIAHWRISEFAADAMVDLGFLDEMTEATTIFEGPAFADPLELQSNVTFLGKPIFLHEAPLVTVDPSADDLVREALLTN